MTSEEELTDLLRLRRTKQCPRCHVAIERRSGCPSFFCICGHHFNYEQAPSLIAGEVKSFDRILHLAQKLQVSFRDVQLAGSPQFAYQVRRTATLLGVSFEQACGLCHEARNGDETARARIRQAKAQQRQQLQEEKEQEEKEEEKEEKKEEEERQQQGECEVETALPSSSDELGEEEASGAGLPARIGAEEATSSKAFVEYMSADFLADDDCDGFHGEAWPL